jgi:UDP-N-acetylglucosamine--dolichyl-phosphate N-acetylglucosaminephosphotransferase
MPFPRVKDYHKPGQPLVPNAYGIFYAMVSVCYWFIISFLGYSIPWLRVYSDDALALATSVLFGSTMGLIDDMIDLRWRYKAVLPVFASLPYIALAVPSRTSVQVPFIGLVELNVLFFYLLVPLIVTVTTNTYNQLGGLNGLESLSGLIVLAGLSLAAQNLLLTIVPLLCLVWLGYLGFTGKAFVGNVGTFSIGLTLAIFSVLMDVKMVLLICLVPFVLNSVMILSSNYLMGARADTLVDEHGHLYSTHVRSLRTLILHGNPMGERRAVLVLCGLVAMSTGAALVVRWLS